MIQIFLSYARADGLEAATRLRNELMAMGFQVWRDIEEMRGGLAWKRQLREAIRNVDAVLVLLTPAAVASTNVTYEWETALLEPRRVIPLLIQPCDVPAELRRLHYHTLSDPASYTLGLARLARDLMALGREPAREGPPPGRGDQYVVLHAEKSAIGHQPTVVNVAGGSTAHRATLGRIVAYLRSQPAEIPDQALAAELRAMLRAELDQYRRNLAGLRVQAAKHGGPDYAPTALCNEMRDTEMAIERVEQELVQLEEC